MPTMVNDGGGMTFTPAPMGLHRAVCCDVVELGWLDTKWGKKRTICICWQILATMEDGKPYMVTERYNATLYESNLLAALESWRGRPFTDEERKNFDVDSVLGAQCQINVVHNTSSKNGKLYANASAIVPGMKGLPPLVVRDYIRVRDRDGYQAPDLAPPDQPAQSVDPSEEPPQHGPDADDDIPF